MRSLFDKLLEEGEELREASAEQRLEEMGDVFEVLCSVARATGHSWEEVVASAEQKRRERGGFDGRIWLERW